MTDQYVGEIRAVGFNFAPSGWAMCNGQLLPIAQNTALFSLLGTNYGGDGKTTFALPNLQTRFPVAWGSTPGLTAYDVGDQDGAATVTLLAVQMAAHTHSAQASSEAGSVDSPVGAVWAQPHFGRTLDNVYATTGGTALMSSGAVTATGSGQPHNNLPPYLVVNFVIALVGIFPPRG